MNPVLEKPRIGLTLGDPSGIGPEVTLKAISSLKVRKACFPVVVGSLNLIERTICQFSLPLRIEKKEGWFQLRATHGPPVRIVVEGSESDFDKTAENLPARLAMRWIVQGARLALSGLVDALTTAPVSKESFLRSGVSFTGHTELLASLSRGEEVTMMFVAPGLITSIATTHLPIREVSRALTRKRILSAIVHTHIALKKFFRKRNPRIALCGLNPHAGEGGFVGDEEEKIVLPGIRAARRKGINSFGPFSADSIFGRALEGEFDAVIAMFHDQALPVLKTLFPEKCVNVTLGLPFVRTSPGHGTASDIAWKGQADEAGMIEAILLAAKLSKAWKRPLTWTM